LAAMGTDREQADLSEIVDITGIPHITQPATFWCGETALSMLLGHAGYPHLTPEVIYEKAKELYDPDVHRSRADMLTGGDPYQVKHPDINQLAYLVKELTNGEVTAHIVNTAGYEKLNALRKANGKPDLTPFDVLQNNLRGGRPCTGPNYR
jgi:hypothetical protein